MHAFKWSPHNSSLIIQHAIQVSSAFSYHAQAIYHGKSTMPGCNHCWAIHNDNAAIFSRTKCSGMGLYCFFLHLLNFTICSLSCTVISTPPPPPQPMPFLNCCNVVSPKHFTHKLFFLHKDFNCKSCKRKPETLVETLLWETFITFLP